MKLVEYVKDHLLMVLLYVGVVLFQFLALGVFQVNLYINLMCTGLFLLCGIFIFLVDYQRTARFYKKVQELMHTLDQKYLVHEMLDEPLTYEERLLQECFQEINKSMLDYLNEYKFRLEDFKEYLEMWIHEIKIPLASAKLILENRKDKFDVSMEEELKRIENLIEQVLFYVRSENVEKDYTVRQCVLEDIVKEVIVKNRRSFIYKKIALSMEGLDGKIYTDSKWLEFILNQIVANSIKYAKEEEAHIRIYAQEEENRMLLYVEDNGIGISSNDLPRVFEKGFTGSNGRQKYNSTGIGLYLCRSLCEKLHHEIYITSVLGEKTVVSIVFPKHDEMQNIY